MPADIPPESAPPTEAELARLLKILWEHIDNGHRSDPAAHIEYEALMLRLRALDHREFCAAIARLGTVLFQYGRMVAEWGERPHTELLTFLDLAATERC